MVRVLANGQVKRSREEERTTTDTHLRSFAHHHYRHHRQSSISSARGAETTDPDLETQIEQLQTCLQTRLRSIRHREEACAADTRKVQQRLENLEERERQLFEREDAVKQQADCILGQQATLQQLQIELLDQYNAVVASLPRLDDRLQAARQFLPEYVTPATSSAKDASLDAAEAGSSAAAQQPDSSAPPLQGAFCDQLPEAPAVTPRIVSNSNTAAVSGLNPDAKREDLKGPDQAETDRPPDATHGDACQPSTKPETAAAALSSDLPRTAAHEQLPAEAPSKICQTQLADASKQHNSQPAVLTSDDDQAEQPPLAASQQQEKLPPPADRHKCAAVASSTNGADPSCSRAGFLVPEHDSVVQSGVLRGPARPASSERTSAQLLTNESSKEPVAAKSAVPANHKHKSSEPCSAAEAKPEQAEVGSVQSRHPRTRKGSQQADSEAQAAANAAVPTVMKLRSRPDSAAAVDKCGVASQVRAESAHRKQPAAHSPRNGPGVTFGSSRGVGRGRAYGRGGRRGRGRSNLFRSSHSEPQPAGDLDEAVQALKATTESFGPSVGIGPAASRTGGANAVEDDDLKPSFMRRAAADRSPPSHGRPLPLPVPVHADTYPKAAPTANEAISQDPNPRPVTRRRTDSSKTAARAKAKAVMQKEVPDLLDILQQKGWADHVDLLEHSDPTAQDIVYLDMHNILSRLCEGKIGSWQGRNVTGKGVVLDGEESSKHEYCLLALEQLLERVDAYSLNSEPVRWGWCRELSSFVFVFEGANRIVVEKPCYGHATYFFDLEEPLPVSSQVQRLIAVLSVPGVSRRKLLEDSSLDPGPDLTDEERKQLEAAGWKPGTTVRSLLNFTGDRIFHQSAEIMTGQKLTQRDVPDYKDKIAKVLSEGASGGRVTKRVQ